MKSQKKFTIKRIISFLKTLDEAELREIERIITALVTCTCPK